MVWYIFVPNMAVLPTLQVLQTLKDKNLRLITKTEISRLFDIQKDNTSYKLLQRLERKGALQRVSKGKYFIPGAEVGDFEIANFILQPSYVSLESALAYYGILSQFPFTITSVTPKRGKKVFFNKEFEYTHLKKELYWGFVKDGGFLIASPEKALLDFLYLVAKGLRTINLEELDLKPLNKSVFKEYASKIKNDRLGIFLKEKKLC